MRRNRRPIRRDRRGFTGLEAAIVLTAFVVVAAVFSYVVLNAGFFTTQTSKQVIHTGVEQATSSIELAGDVIGYGDDNTTGSHPTNLTGVVFYLELGAGEQPLDLNTTVMSYSDKDTLVNNVMLHFGNASNTTYWNGTVNQNWFTKGSWECAYNKSDHTGNWSYEIINSDGDNLLESGEKAKISMALPEWGVRANEQFVIEVKPAMGATIGIVRKAPAGIDPVMNLH